MDGLGSLVLMQAEVIISNIKEVWFIQLKNNDNMYKLGLLLILFTLFSCEKKEEKCCVNVESQVLLNLTNEDSNNIFELNEGSKGLNDLDLYYVDKSGNREIQNHSNLDLPKNMQIIDWEVPKQKILKVFGNLTPQSGGYAESILVVKGYSEVSIKLKIESTDSYKGYSQVMINGQLIPQDQLGKPIRIKLSKE